MSPTPLSITSRTADVHVGGTHYPSHNPSEVSINTPPAKYANYVFHSDIQFPAGGRDAAQASGLSSDRRARLPPPSRDDTLPSMPTTSPTPLSNFDPYR